MTRAAAARIDAHVHLWDGGPRYRWLDDPGLAAIRRPFAIRDLERTLTSNDIDAAVVVEGGCCDHAEGDELLAIAERSSAILGVVAWAEPAAPSLRATLDRWSARPLVGLRAQIQAQPGDEYLRRPDVAAGLAEVAGRGLAFDLVVRRDQLPACASLARTVPELRLVLDHLGKPAVAAGAAGLDEWLRLVRPLARLPNVACKLSGLVTEADRARWTPADLRPFFHAAIDLFGIDRVLFGSDWPVCTLAASYEAVLGALLDAIGTLSPHERDAVLGGNAYRVYAPRTTLGDAGT